MSELKDLSAQSVEITDNGEASLVCETTDGKRFSVALDPVEVESETATDPGGTAEGEETSDGEEESTPEGEQPPA